MAAFLYRVGRFAFLRRWYVVFLWVAVLGGVFMAASRAPAAPADSTAIPGAEFQNANDLLQRAFHANPNGATAQIVFVAPHGQKITAARYQPVISEVVSTAARSPQVVGAATPPQDGEVSRDGSTAIAEINYPVVPDSLTTATTSALNNAAQLGRNAGLTVEIGGDALNAPASDTGVIYGLAVAVMVLLLTFGSLAAAGLPLLTAGISVGLGLSGIIALGKPLGLSGTTLLLVFRSVLMPLKATIGFVLSLLAGLGALVAVFQWGWLAKILGVPATGPIQSFMPIFMVGIAFGLSMDYEVFLVSRIREAYAHGEQPRPAVVSGFGRSGRVVVAAAVIMMAVFAGFVTSSDVLVKMIGFGLAAAILLDAFVVRMTIEARLVAAALARAGPAPSGHRGPGARTPAARGHCRHRHSRASTRKRAGRPGTAWPLGNRAGPSPTRDGCPPGRT